MTNKQIAAELFLSPVTVRKHLENVMAKLDAHTRTAAVAAVRHRSYLIGNVRAGADQPGLTWIGPRPDPGRRRGMREASV